MLSKQVEIRGSIRYSIQYRIRITEPELSLDNRTQSPDLNQKESWSIDRAETENLTELNARSLDTKVELKSIRLRTKILSQFQEHLLKKDQFVDDVFNIFIIYRINQDQDLSKPLKEEPVVCVRCVRTDPDFSVNISVQITGNEVSLISYRKSDIWKTRLIGNIITDQIRLRFRYLVLTK